jgi:elongator complex protein 2
LLDLNLDKDGSEIITQPLVLTSASADKTVIIWMPDKHCESWTPRNRMGELGGSTSDFYGAHFSSDGSKLVANGYHGSLHYWDCRKMEEGICPPMIGSSGHSKSVEELCWDPTGSFLLSCSLDQTCRVFASWNRDSKSSWHEIARTQIHGYDMHSVSFISKYTYVSGYCIDNFRSDEKVVRIFEAPRFFATSLNAITKIEDVETVLDSLPIGANLPALGLSNKAVYGTDIALDSYAAPIQPVGHTQPPLEEELLTSTLWPEIDKLYKKLMLDTDMDMK